MLQGLSGVNVGVASEAPCHEVHLDMVGRSARVNIVSVMFLPHYLVVHVDEVTAGMAVPPCLELWPVLHPALGVVHTHLGLGVKASCQDNSILHLDTTGVPDNEMMLACTHLHSAD